MAPAQPNKSLINGLTCLQALVTADKPVGSRELARQLNLDHTRVNRLLGTLADIGLAEKTPLRKYVPGPGIHVLAAQSIRASGLLTKALPYLEELMKYKMIVAMGVLWNHHVSYLFHAKPGDTFEQGIGGFHIYPAIRSSIGMMLLSCKTNDQIKASYQKTELDIYDGDMGAFLNDIEKIRKQNYSEVVLHDRSIAIAVGNPAYAAIALSGQFRKKDMKEYLSVLKQTAKAIELALGR